MAPEEFYETSGVEDAYKKLATQLLEIIVELPMSIMLPFMH